MSIEKECSLCKGYTPGIMGMALDSLPVPIIPQTKGF